MLRRLLFSQFKRIYTSGLWFRRHFTPAGQGLLAAMSISAVFGIDTTQTLAYQIFAVTAVLLLLAVVSGWFFRARFSLRRVLPPFGTVGEPLYYHMEVKNLNPKVQRGLGLLEHLQLPRIRYREFYGTSRPGFFLSGNRFDDYIGYPRWVALMEERCGAQMEEQTVPPLLPRATTEVRMELLPGRRGYIHFSACSLVCPDPLGLFKRFYRHNCADNLLILPKRYPVPDLQLPGKRCYQPGGINLAMSVGDSVEFVSLREYRPGDPLRHIHWKSWARRGKPIVKEFQDEFFTRHAMLLDTFVPPGKQQCFEEAVSVASSFACRMLTQDTLLDVMFVGDKAYHFTGGRGLGHLDEMLEMLACVEACEDRGIESLLPLAVAHAGSLSACVCVLLAWDEPRRQLVAGLRQFGLPLLVLVVTMPEDPEPDGELHRLRVGRIAEDLAQLPGGGL